MQRKKLSEEKDAVKDTNISPLLKTSTQPKKESDKIQKQHKESSLDPPLTSSEGRKGTSEEERIRIAEHTIAHGYRKTIDILSEEFNRPITMGTLCYALKWYRNSDLGN